MFWTLLVWNLFFHFVMSIGFSSWSVEHCDKVLMEDGFFIHNFRGRHSGSSSTVTTCCWIGKTVLGPISGKNFVSKSNRNIWVTYSVGNFLGLVLPTKNFSSSCVKGYCTCMGVTLNYAFVMMYICNTVLKLCQSLKELTITHNHREMIYIEAIRML